MKPITVLVLLCVVAFACAPAAVTPKPIEHTAQTPQGRACETLKALGCPEGSPSRSGLTCVEAWVKLEELRDMPSACVEAAQTVAAVRACGGVRCLSPK